MLLVRKFSNRRASLVALFSFIILLTACEQPVKTPTDKEIPKEALEEMEKEKKDVVEAVELTEDAKIATLENELRDLELLIQEESSPSRARSEKSDADPIPRGSYEECMKNCDKILDKMEHTTQSGSTVNAHNDCIDGCKELLKVKKAFMECIKDAKTEEDKKKCRKTYMDERPW